MRIFFGTRWAIGVCALVVGCFTLRARAVLNADVTSPGDPIVGVAATVGSATSNAAAIGTAAGLNNYPLNENPPNAIDNVNTDKYLNFQKTGAGFIVTPSSGASILSGVHFVTGNDSPERDPLTISIEGTGSPNATNTLNSTWTLLFTGSTGLETDPGRNASGFTGIFVPKNPGAFTSYRLLVSSVRDTPASANSFQFADVELIGTTVPEPGVLGLVGVMGLAGVRRRR